MSAEDELDNEDVDITDEDMEAAEKELTLEKEGEQPKDTIKRLREDLKECTAKKQEYLSGWQRAKADLVNAKKEFDRERERIENRTISEVVSDLLPVLDSFTAMKESDNWEAVDEQWQTGVEQIHKQLISAITDQGVEQITPEPGDEFDPQVHTSTQTQPADEDNPDNTIAEVEKVGYKISDRIIRSAHVVVYTREEQTQTKEQASGEESAAE